MRQVSCSIGTPVSGAIAVAPSTILAQNVLRSLPAGETTPTPVTTTLRTSARIDESLYGANDIADCAQCNGSGFIGIVGDLNPELGFDFVDDFQEIKRFDTERGEVAIVRNFFGRPAQLLCNDPLDGFGDLHATGPRQMTSNHTKR